MRLSHLEMLPIRAFKKCPVSRRLISLEGGKGGSAPDAPDYERLAKLEAANQQKLLEQQTVANRVNQYGPLGSVTYTRGTGDRTFDQAAYDNAMQQYQQRASAGNRTTKPYNSPLYNYLGVQPTVNTGGATRSGGMLEPNRDDFYTGGGDPNQWNQYTTLSPEMQSILDQNLAAKGQGYDQLQTALGNINNNNLPLASVNAGETAQDAILRRVNPQLDIQENQLRQRLVNQGLRPGTPAWDREMTLMNQSRNDAVSQAALQGINVGNDARARALAEQGIPLNLINAYQSGGQAQMPQYQGYSQAGLGQSPDLMGAAQSTYGADVNKANAQNAADSNMQSGLFALGTTAAMYF